MEPARLRSGDMRLRMRSASRKSEEEQRRQVERNAINLRCRYRNGQSASVIGIILFDEIIECRSEQFTTTNALQVHAGSMIVHVSHGQAFF